MEEKCIEYNDLKDFVCFYNWILVVFCARTLDDNLLLQPLSEYLRAANSQNKYFHIRHTAVRCREMCSLINSFSSLRKMACHGLFVQPVLCGSCERDERNQYRRKHIREIKLILKSSVHVGLEKAKGD